MDGIKEAIGIEQFLNTLPLEKRIWLTEGKPRTCVEAGELLDEYEQARKQDPSGQKTTPHKKCNFCHKQRHLEQKCRKRKASGAGVHTGETGQPMCFKCRKYGHISKRCPKKSALMCPLPIVSEPFSGIAMDIVEPLPCTKLGKRYILIIRDYATRYLEDIPLSSIDAEHVAEKLIQVFSRMGVPQEILTDQGSNFTSQLLDELYRLLHIYPIQTWHHRPTTDRTQK